MTTAFITHGDYLKHVMGADHPECPERLGAITQYLASTELGDRIKWLAAQTASNEQIERVHPAEYICWLDSLQPDKGLVYADADTALNPHTMRAARLAAGAVTMATDMVLDQQVTNAFCAVRPPGHHAETSTAMGFCFFNNIAVGVEHALSREEIKRVAILDFDVHHCNGTIDSFKNRPEVLVCSTFQHPFYPLRYYDIQRPNIINSPLRAGTKGSEFRLAIKRDWLPALHKHQPQMIFISAGFDAHKDDPLGQLLLDESDYRWVTNIITDAAACYAKDRIVSTLEGGYNLLALAHSVHAHIDVLAGKTSDT